MGRRGRCRRRCRRPTWAPRGRRRGPGGGAGAPRAPALLLYSVWPDGSEAAGAGAGRGRPRAPPRAWDRRCGARGDPLYRSPWNPCRLGFRGGAGEEVGTVSARSRVAGSPRWGKASVAPREGERCRDRGASAHLAYRRACRRAYPLLCLCVRRVPTGGRAPWARASADWSGKARGWDERESGKRNLARRPRDEGSHRGTTLRRRARSVDRVETRTHLFFLFPALGHHRELLHCD